MALYKINCMLASKKWLWKLVEYKNFNNANIGKPVWLPTWIPRLAALVLLLGCLHFFSWSNISTVVLYTVQLSSKVTLAHVCNACKTHPNAHEMHPQHMQDASVQAQNLVIKLHQDLINCNALFARHRTHPQKCVQDACSKSVKHYLGAELYHRWWWAVGVVHTKNLKLSSNKKKTFYNHTVQY